MLAVQNRRKSVSEPGSPTNVLDLGNIPRAVWHRVCPLPPGVADYARPARSQLTSSRRWYTRWKYRPPVRPQSVKPKRLPATKPNPLPGKTMLASPPRPDSRVHPPLPMVRAALDLIERRLHHAPGRTRKRAGRLPRANTCEIPLQHTRVHNLFCNYTTNREWSNLTHLSYLYHSRLERWREPPSSGGSIGAPRLNGAQPPEPIPRHLRP